MKLVPTDTPLERPGICFLCEGEPTRERGELVVDTEHQFNPPGFSHLRGRKYVCERCVREAHDLLPKPVKNVQK